MVQPNDRWIRYSRKAQNQEGAGRNEEEKSTSDYFYGIRPKKFLSNGLKVVTTLSPLIIDKASGLAPDPASFQGELHGF